jgi:hypothetical protein
MSYNPWYDLQEIKKLKKEVMDTIGDRHDELDRIMLDSLSILERVETETDEAEVHKMLKKSQEDLDALLASF